MPLSAFQNTFAGNPLNRASERRGDASWLAEKLAEDGIAFFTLRIGRVVDPDFLEHLNGGVGIQVFVIRTFGIDNRQQPFLNDTDAAMDLIESLQALLFVPGQPPLLTLFIEVCGLSKELLHINVMIMPDVDHRYSPKTAVSRIINQEVRFVH